MALRLSAGNGDYNYGYLRLTYDADEVTITLHELVWETEVNTPITVNSIIPEPATYAALLAVGVAGVVIARRRRC